MSARRDASAATWVSGLVPQGQAAANMEMTSLAAAWAAVMQGLSAWAVATSHRFPRLLSVMATSGR